MRNLYKFMIYGDEPSVRQAAGNLPESVEGFNALHVFFRGSALFVATDGPGRPFEALARDAKAKKFLEALEESTSFTHDDPDKHALGIRQALPAEGGAPPARDTAAAKEASP